VHKLQQHILKSLTNNASLRYARLKPEEVAGNAFMYHLKQLIKAGYVEHNDESYSLTPQGKLYIDRVRLKTFTVPLQPKIVILIVARNEAGELLCYERARNPLINMVGLPYGKLHIDETLEESAAREFNKKTGYDADFTYHSSGIMRIREAGELTSYISFLLVEATNIRGEMLDNYRSGRAFWTRPELISADKLIPTLNDSLRLIDENITNFSEFTYDL
jgi:ADP-ribose pyrophosphatase YjhB (NUDIX family)